MHDIQTVRTVRVRDRIQDNGDTDYKKKRQITKTFSEKTKQVRKDFMETAKMEIVCSHVNNRTLEKPKDYNKFGRIKCFENTKTYRC